MNDRQKEILLKLYKRLDLVVTGVLILLLVYGGYLILAEKNYTAAELPAPAPRAPEYRIPVAGVPNVTNADYDEIIANYVKTNPDINADEKARRIIQNNMFAMKSAEETQAIREEMNALYNQAERAEQAGRYDESRKLVSDILSRDPSNALAKQLRDKMDAREKAAAATPAAPGAVPPPSTPPADAPPAAAAGTPAPAAPAGTTPDAAGVR
ncbi:hypothetical protein BH09SUM1_BH09SUM1_17720 [soil metagenome]